MCLTRCTKVLIIATLVVISAANTFNISYICPEREQTSYPAPPLLIPPDPLYGDGFVYNSRQDAAQAALFAGRVQRAETLALSLVASEQELFVLVVDRTGVPGLMRHEGASLAHLRSALDIFDGDTGRVIGSIEPLSRSAVFLSPASGEVRVQNVETMLDDCKRSDIAAFYAVLDKISAGGAPGAANRVSARIARDALAGLSAATVAAHLNDAELEGAFTVRWPAPAAAPGLYAPSMQTAGDHAMAAATPGEKSSLIRVWMDATFRLVQAAAANGFSAPLEPYLTLAAALEADADVAPVSGALSMLLAEDDTESALLDPNIVPPFAILAEPLAAHARITRALDKWLETLAAELPDDAAAHASLMCAAKSSWAAEQLGGNETLHMLMHSFSLTLALRGAYAVAAAPAPPAPAGRAVREPWILVPAPLSHLAAPIFGEAGRLAGRIRSGTVGPGLEQLDPVAKVFISYIEYFTELDAALTSGEAGFTAEERQPAVQSSYDVALGAAGCGEKLDRWARTLGTGVRPAAGAAHNAAEWRALLHYSTTEAVDNWALPGSCLRPDAAPATAPKSTNTALDGSPMGAAIEAAGICAPGLTPVAGTPPINATGPAAAALSSCACPDWARLSADSAARDFPYYSLAAGRCLVLPARLGAPSAGGPLPPHPLPDPLLPAALRVEGRMLGLDSEGVLAPLACAAAAARDPLWSAVFPKEIPHLSAVGALVERPAPGAESFCVAPVFATTPHFAKDASGGLVFAFAAEAAAVGTTAAPAFEPDFPVTLDVSPGQTVLEFRGPPLDREDAVYTATVYFLPLRHARYLSLRDGAVHGTQAPIEAGLNAMMVFRRFISPLCGRYAGPGPDSIPNTADDLISGRYWNPRVPTYLQNFYVGQSPVTAEGQLFVDVSPLQGQAGLLLVLESQFDVCAAMSGQPWTAAPARAVSLRVRTPTPCAAGPAIPLAVVARSASYSESKRIDEAVGADHVNSLFTDRLSAPFFEQEWADGLEAGGVWPPAHGGPNGLGFAGRAPDCATRPGAPHYHVSNGVCRSLSSDLIGISHVVVRAYTAAIDPLTTTGAARADEYQPSLKASICEVLFAGPERTVFSPNKNSTALWPSEIRAGLHRYVLCLPESATSSVISRELITHPNAVYSQGGKYARCVAEYAAAPPPGVALVSFCGWPLWEATSAVHFERLNTMHKCAFCDDFGCGTTDLVRSPPAVAALPLVRPLAARYSAGPAPYACTGDPPTPIEPKKTLGSWLISGLAPCPGQEGVCATAGRPLLFRGAGLDRESQFEYWAGLTRSAYVAEGAAAEIYADLIGTNEAGFEVTSGGWLSGRLRPGVRLPDLPPGSIVYLVVGVRQSADSVEAVGGPAGVDSVWTATQQIRVLGPRLKAPSAARGSRKLPVSASDLGFGRASLAWPAVGPYSGCHMPFLDRLGDLGAVDRISAASPSRPHVLTCSTQYGHACAGVGPTAAPAASALLTAGIELCVAVVPYHEAQAIAAGTGTGSAALLAVAVVADTPSPNAPNLLGSLAEQQTQMAFLISALVVMLGSLLFANISGTFGVVAAVPRCSRPLVALPTFTQAWIPHPADYLPGVGFCSGCGDDGRVVPLYVALPVNAALSDQQNARARAPICTRCACTLLANAPELCSSAFVQTSGRAFILP